MPRKLASYMPIAVIDAETDPGKHGRTPKPFAWGWYDGAYYQQFWGNDATEQLLAFLKKQRPHQIFAHNGGRFDFAYFNKLLNGKPLIIGSRIVDATLFQHTVSDSYARIPVPLARFGEKQEIDYGLFEAPIRDTAKVRPVIEAYLKQDCLLLYKVIFNWLEKYGRKPSTMASAAFKECEKAMDGTPGIKSRMYPSQDTQFRKFYYGGRVQAFQTGIVRKPVCMHDVNSMYPYAMCKYQHPLSADPLDWNERSKEIGPDTDFAIIDAWSKGALPLRLESGHLHFPSCYSRFYATGHEIRAALALDMLKIDRVVFATTCRVRGNFKRFIDPLYAERMCYKAVGDIMMTEFTKLEMNGTYGKYAINPRKFRSWIFVTPDKVAYHDIAIRKTPDGKSTLSLLDDKGNLYWCDQMPGPGAEQLRFSRLTHESEDRKGFRNVAIAASITGAARAELFTGLCHATSPLYCDTDAIVAATVSGLRFSETELGAWKFEAEGDEMLIGGKKLYALLGERPKSPAKAADRLKRYGEPGLLDGSYRGADLADKIAEAERCVKLACKGGRLYVSQMRQIAQGETVAYYGDMPVFDKFGLSQFDKAKDGNAAPKLFRMTNPHLVSPFPGPVTRGDVAGGLDKVTPLGGW